MSTTTSTPRVWIGCLAAYNEGHLHGEWVDATDADELQEAYERVIKSSPALYPEESFIADYEGFGRLASDLGEYPNYDDVARIGMLIEEHGEPFLAYAGTCDEAAEVTEDDFMEHYRGEWASGEDYAEYLICELGWAGVPPGPIEVGYRGQTINPIEELLPYLNMELIVQELFQHGNYTAIQASDYSCYYVFEDEV